MTKEILKKIHIILLVFAIVITALQVNSFADGYTCKLELIPNKTKIKAGETVTLTVKVSDIQAEEGLVNYVPGSIEYPTDTFDMKIIENDNWTDIDPMEDVYGFTIKNLEASSDDQEIFKIELTAKTDAQVGNKTITLKSNEFTGSKKVKDGDGNDKDEAISFTVADVPTTIEIIANDDGTPDDGTQDDGIPDDGIPDDGTQDDGTQDDGTQDDGTQDDGTQDDGTQDDEAQDDGKKDEEAKDDKTEEKKPDDNKSNNKLPETGYGPNYLLGAIIATIAVSIGFYIKYRRAY